MNDNSDLLSTNILLSSRPKPHDLMNGEVVTETPCTSVKIDGSQDKLILNRKSSIKNLLQVAATNIKQSTLLSTNKENQVNTTEDSFTQKVQCPNLQRANPNCDSLLESTQDIIHNDLSKRNVEELLSTNVNVNSHTENHMDSVPSQNVSCIKNSNTNHLRCNVSRDVNNIVMDTVNEVIQSSYELQQLEKRPLHDNNNSGYLSSDNSNKCLVKSTVQIMPVLNDSCCAEFKTCLNTCKLPSTHTSDDKPKHIISDPGLVNQVIDLDDHEDDKIPFVASLNLCEIPREKQTTVTSPLYTVNTVASHTQKVPKLPETNEKFSSVDNIDEEKLSLTSVNSNKDICSKRKYNKETDDMSVSIPAANMDDSLHPLKKHKGSDASAKNTMADDGAKNCRVVHRHEKFQNPTVTMLRHILKPDVSSSADELSSPPLLEKISETVTSPINPSTVFYTPRPLTHHVGVEANRIVILTGNVLMNLVRNKLADDIRPQCKKLATGFATRLRAVENRMESEIQNIAALRQLIIEKSNYLTQERAKQSIEKVEVETQTVTPTINLPMKHMVSMLSPQSTMGPPATQRIPDLVPHTIQHSVIDPSSLPPRIPNIPGVSKIVVPPGVSMATRLSLQQVSVSSNPTSLQSLLFKPSQMGLDSNVVPAGSAIPANILLQSVPPAPDSFTQRFYSTSSVILDNQVQPSNAVMPANILYQSLPVSASATTSPSVIYAPSPAPLENQIVPSSTSMLTAISLQPITLNQTTNSPMILTPNQVTMMQLKDQSFVSVPNGVIPSTSLESLVPGQVIHVQPNQLPQVPKVIEAQDSGPKGIANTPMENPIREMRKIIDLTNEDVTSFHTTKPKNENYQTMTTKLSLENNSEQPPVYSRALSSSQVVTVVMSSTCPTATKSRHCIPKVQVVKPVSLVKCTHVVEPQHPAELPDIEEQVDLINNEHIPPQPTLTLTPSNNIGIVLSWNLSLQEHHSTIQSYRIYAYRETSQPPTKSLWQKVGEVSAMALPMACTLTEFQHGQKYHFSIQAVDEHKRLGPFSKAASITLLSDV